MIVFPVWPVSAAQKTQETQEQHLQSNSSNKDADISLSDDGNYVILPKEELISSLDKLIKSIKVSTEKNTSLYKYKSIKAIVKDSDKFSNKQLSLFQTYDLGDKPF